jgi:hypothetical protein
MKIRTILGLGAIGGFLYAHNKRGGEWSLDGFKSTAKNLFGRAKGEAMELKDRAEKSMVHDVAKNVANATDADIVEPRRY